MKAARHFGRINEADAVAAPAPFLGNRLVPAIRDSEQEQAGLEAEIADLVETAFGLTPADVALIWSSAPPRMPGRLQAEQIAVTTRP